MHELLEAIFGTCPHGLPGYHWLVDMWFLFVTLPLVIYVRMYAVSAWSKAREFFKSKRSK